MDELKNDYSIEEIEEVNENHVTDKNVSSVSQYRKPEEINPDRVLFSPKTTNSKEQSQAQLEENAQSTKDLFEEVKVKINSGDYSIANGYDVPFSSKGFNSS
ncbi:hypothetical protein [Paenibacillus alkalitolerans]|uniref:hypothetical protein n=1 Tax=Paenibacillus alkalitolerans TaxID=2799335 RepID=UPI0018F3EAEA|nr:hypothetical protein [Paenibacillus alkalitolerans]